METVNSVNNEHTSYAGSQGKVLVTKYHNKLLTLLIKDNRLLMAAASGGNLGKVGSIYIGKVKRVVKNMDACFVEIAGKELCYLPFSACKYPYLTNRKYDGRIMEGDELPVQIAADTMKSKQTTLTANISLAGRLLVFTVGSTRVNLSAKISRDRKNAIISYLQQQDIVTPDGKVINPADMPPFGIIVRTEAKAAESDNLLLTEYHNLYQEFCGLFRNAAHRACFTCLKEPLKDYQAALQQIYQEEYSEIVTDLPDIYEELEHYLKEQAGENQINLRLYADKEYSLQKLYSIDSKIKEALSPRVWLKSGAYLIIEPTEALTVIDVNSGKCEAKKGVSASILNINMEAAREIAIQLRLRNLSGIIIVDFINMQMEEHQDKLLGYFKNLVRNDRTKTVVVDITPLGLVELTRKKVNKALKEQLS